MPRAMGYQGGWWQAGSALNQQLLGRLASGSNWFAADAIGVCTSSNSQALDAAGAWTADASGILSLFTLRIEQALGGAYDFEVYAKPFATGLWAPTGIILSLGAADLYAEEDATPLQVDRFDQVALVNIAVGAAFPGATVFSALFV